MDKLSDRELTLIRRAAEDAIEAWNRHYKPFIDVVAHPLNICTLVDMAKLSLTQQKRVDALTLALDQIAYPIPHMQKEAELNGCELNGYWAVKMSEDHTYSKDIARRALEKEQALKGGEV